MPPRRKPRRVAVSVAPSQRKRFRQYHIPTAVSHSLRQPRLVLTVNPEVANATRSGNSSCS